MSFIDPLYPVFLATGLTVGFGHCIGMCGPIIVSLSLGVKERDLFFPHLAYHAGRITTYALLGGIMGLTGSFTAVTGSIAGLQKGILIFAGLLIMVMGVGMTGWIPWTGIFGDSDGFQGILSRGFRKLIAAKPTAKYYPLGLLLGLLPCGAVYTALIASARAGMEAGNAWEGGIKGTLLMLAFGLGTLPALLVLARLAGSGWLKSRRIIYRAGAVLMIGVGIYFVIRGILY